METLYGVFLVFFVFFKCIVVYFRCIFGVLEGILVSFWCFVDVFCLKRKKSQKSEVKKRNLARFGSRFGVQNGIKNQ